MNKKTIYKSGVINNKNFSRIKEAQVLREQLYVKDYKWVPKRYKTAKRERDTYDKKAVHFAVYGIKRTMEGYLRILPGTEKFMLEEVFYELLDGTTIEKGSDVLEVTRLTTSPRVRENNDAKIVTYLLFRELLKYSVANGFKKWYIVVRKSYFRLLNRDGFKSIQIGKDVTYEDGTLTVAAFVDIEIALNNLKGVNPELYQWFAEYANIEK